MTDTDETLTTLTEDEYKAKFLLMLGEDSMHLVPGMIDLMGYIKGHDENKYEEYYKKLVTILNETHRKLHDVFTLLIEDALSAASENQ